MAMHLMSTKMIRIWGILSFLTSSASRLSQSVENPITLNNSAYMRNCIILYLYSISKVKGTTYQMDFTNSKLQA